MENIELLESVNHAARNWKNVIDQRMNHTAKALTLNLTCSH